MAFKDVVAWRKNSAGDGAPFDRRRSMNWGHLRGKRRAAAAGGGGVGIAEFETAAVQAGDEVDDRAAQIGRDRAVHVNGESIEYEHHVIGLRPAIEIELVGKSGTAAVGDAHAQGLAFAPVARQQFFYLGNRALGQAQVQLRIGFHDESYHSRLMSNEGPVNSRAFTCRAAPARTGPGRRAADLPRL